MATFTKRIDASIRQLSDRYNSHWAGDGWKCDENYGQVGKTDEFESDGEWYGGIKNLSLRFINVTIPQGTTITSAKITLTDNSSGGSEQHLNFKICGIDEDDTAEFTTSPISDARTRTHTTATVDWDLTFTHSNGTARDSSDIKTIIQEIVDRASWASGNDLGIYLYDDGTSNDYWDIKYYSSYPDNVALLTIEYESVTTSTSSSTTTTTTSTTTTTTSTSTTSTTTSTSTTTTTTLPPIFPLPFEGIKFSKEKINVLQTNDPRNLTFSSHYPNLKYYEKRSIRLFFDAGAGDISAKGTYQHNLGYYPFIEVFSSLGSGSYEYCPFYGAGATIAYSTNYIITKTDIQFFCEISGVSADVWTFDFIFFIFKNNLGF